VAKNGFKVFDSDLHVQEPWDLWLRYIEPRYKDRAPIGARNYVMDPTLVHEGKAISKVQLNTDSLNDQVMSVKKLAPRQAYYKEAEKRGFGPDTQIEAMDQEGVDVAVLFPTRGLFAHAKEYDDDNLAAAISRAYNDWLVEFCAYAPDRMYGAAMIPAQNIPAAVEEVKRAKKDLGFKAIFVRPNPMRGRNWHDPYYDPLWAECEKQGLAVGFHEGYPCELPVAMADRFVADGVNTWTTEHVACHPVEMMYACLSMIAGGVCAKFPALRVGFLEGNCAWAPYWLWRMDEHWEAANDNRTAESPSTYFIRQCVVSVEADEEVGSQAVEWLQGNNIVFSTDYPHSDSKFPNALGTFFKRSFPDEAKRKILWDNPRRLYGFQ
jgi:uncharacterized protein